MIDITQIALFLSVLLISVSLHEVMHAYIAYRLGDDLAHSQGRISFNPLVHIDPILTIALPLALLLIGQISGSDSIPLVMAAKPVPINTSRLKGEEFGLMTVGVSGPLVNLALAFIGGFILNSFALSGVALDFMGLFVIVNVSLFVFNMLPIPPLDGSRILYAVAPESVQRVMRQIEGYGIFGLILIFYLLSPVISPLLLSARQFILALVV